MSLLFGLVGFKEGINFDSGLMYLMCLKIASHISTEILSIVHEGDWYFYLGTLQYRLTPFIFKGVPVCLQCDQMCFRLIPL